MHLASNCCPQDVVKFMCCFVSGALLRCFRGSYHAELVGKVLLSSLIREKITSYVAEVLRVGLGL